MYDIRSREEKHDYYYYYYYYVRIHKSANAIVVFSIKAKHSEIEIFFPTLCA